MRLAQEDSLVSKNARFAHDMVNFGNDVRGKRFSAHAIRVNRDFTLSPQSPSPRMMFVPGKNKKAPRKTEVLFLEWEQRESNPRPSACKADALNQLSYAPKRFFNLWLLNQDLNLGPSD